MTITENSGKMGVKGDAKVKPEGSEEGAHYPLGLGQLGWTFLTALDGRPGSLQTVQYLAWCYVQHWKPCYETGLFIIFSVPYKMNNSCKLLTGSWALEFQPPPYCFLGSVIRLPSVSWYHSFVLRTYFYYVSMGGGVSTGGGGARKGAWSLWARVSQPVEEQHSGPLATFLPYSQANFLHVSNVLLFCPLWVSRWTHVWCCLGMWIWNSFLIAFISTVFQYQWPDPLTYWLQAFSILFNCSSHTCSQFLIIKTECPKEW